MSRTLGRFAIVLGILAIGVAFTFFSKYQEHDFDYNVRAARHRIEQDPGSLDAMQEEFNLGLYYEKNGQVGEAYESFRRVREVYHHQYPNYHYGFLSDEATWKMAELKNEYPNEVNRENE